MTTVATRLDPAPPHPRADQALVRMRDGVRLATDVYLPAGPGPHPAVLVRLPYDKSSPFAFMPVVARYLNDRGYALVAQDVRGKVRSEGETFAFVHEVADGYDTLEWLAGRGWCDERAIGMFGDSYYGYTQWAAAASGHPALRAIVPRMTTTDVGADWMHHGGVFNLATMGDWAAHTWVDRDLWQMPWDYGVRPLAEMVPRWLDGRRSASLDHWRRLGPQDPWWGGLLGAGWSAGALSIPALHMGGLWDVFLRGQVADWRQARDAGRAEQLLVLDVTDHFDTLLREDGEPYVDELADEAHLERFMPRYLGAAVAFFDRHLRGHEDAVPAAVRYHLAGAGWQEAATWPPPGATPLVLHLDDGPGSAVGPEGGALSAHRPARSAKAGWEHDPERLVPSLVTDPWRPLAGLPDERDVQTREDVLTFTAEPAGAPLDLVGPASARLWVSSTGPSLHVLGKLSDVYPSGRARRIAEGALHVRAAGEPVLADVDLGHLAYRLAPGHRLRLEVASSSFPRYLPHPGTDDDPWEPGRLQVTAQTLHLGGEAGSCLRLSVHHATGSRA